MNFKKKLSRILTSVLSVAMISATLCVPVSAADTPAELTLDKVYKHKGTWATPTAEVTVAESYTIPSDSKHYFVFNDIENGSAIKNADFYIGDGEGSTTFSSNSSIACSWAVVDHEIDTKDKMHAILESNNTTTDGTYKNVKTSGTGTTTLVDDPKAVAAGATNNKMYNGFIGCTDG